MSQPPASGEGPARVLIMGWTHATGVVMSLARALGVGLGQAGARVSLANLSLPGHRQAVAACAPDAFDRVIAVGALCLDASAGGAPLYEHFQGRFDLWVMDPLVYDLTEQKPARRYLAATQRDARLGWLFPDRSYLALAEFLGAGGARYFPFAGDYFALDGARWPGEPAPAPRDGVVVLGHLGAELTPHGARTADEVIAALDPFGLAPARRRALAEQVTGGAATANVAWAAQAALQLDPATLMRPEVLALIAALDSSEKRRRRLAAIESAGPVPIDIHGAGWRAHLGERANITYREGPVGHAGLFALFSRYQVLFDFAPNWDRGFNDRVATALGAGCRVVTSDNDAIGALDAGAAAGLVTGYRPQQPQAGPALAAALAAGPIAPQVQAQVRAELAWRGAAARLDGGAGPG